MKNKLNRRKFIKATATSATGIIAVPYIVRANDREDIIKRFNDKPIIKRTLGNTDLEIPIVSMGVMRSDNETVVKAAIEAGITHFDTAHHYQRGKNEEMLGELFSNYDRDSIIIGTKVLPEDYYVNQKYEKLGETSTKEKFLERLETSLQRLKMEYVDILYLHAIRSYDDTLFDPMLEALKKAKEQGKARFIGVSTHRHEEEVIQAAIDSEVYDVVLTGINFNRSNKDKIVEKIALANEKGIGIIAMKTMAGSFWDKERTKPINCKAALKWVLKDKNIHTSIPAMVSFNQLEENLSVMENLEMTEEEKISLIPPEDLQAGLYCSGCDECIEQCPQQLPIPDISRAYMYAYGYKERKKAQELITHLNIDDNACEECPECIVKCPNGFVVDEKIKDIKRIQNIPEEFLS